MVVVMTFGIASCSSSDDVATTTPKAAPAEPSGDGTREDPFSLGQAVTVGPWEVTITEVNTDVDDVQVFFAVK